MEKRISGHTGLMGLFGTPVGHSDPQQCIISASSMMDWTMPIWHLT